MNIVDKLFDRLVITDSGCLEFVGARTGAGYGAVCTEGKTLGAHRITYEFFNGDIPKGLIIRHDCDNPACCNFEHLSLGTVQDNKNDEMLRDRHVYGERVGNHKLTEDDVRLIRSMLDEGLSLRFIGDKFNVTPQAIHRIKSGLSWGWLQ